MKIFLSASNKDKGTAEKFIDRIKQNKDIEISYFEDVKSGELFDEFIQDKIAGADVHIIIYTENSIRSRGIKEELLISSTIQMTKGTITILPVVIDAVSLDNKKRKSIRIDSSDIDSGIQEVVQRLEQIKRDKESKKIKSIEITQEIESKTGEYLDSTKQGLIKKGKKFSISAFALNALGLLLLIGGVGLGYIIYSESIDLLRVNDKIFWGLTISFTLKGTIMIILIVSASRYCFNLGKMYMNESLKNSDRVHALKFGEIYVKRFDKEMDQEAFKEAFQDWNYTSKTSFSDIDTKDTDYELMIKVMQVMKLLNSSEKVEH